MDDEGTFLFRPEAPGSYRLPFTLPSSIAQSRPRVSVVRPCTDTSRSDAGRVEGSESAADGHGTARPRRHWTSVGPA